MTKFIQPMLTVSAGVLTYAFGEWMPLYTALVCVVCIDYITGIIAAAVNRKLSSGKGFTGILKKVFIFLIVAAAVVFDTMIPSANNAIGAAVCMFYIANELLSIIENAGEIGIPMPQVLIDAVETLRKKK